MRFIVIVLLLSASAGYASEFTLDRINHIGIRKIDSLKKEKGQYVFNGVNLGSQLPAPILRSWAEVLKTEKTPKGRDCHAGSYLIVKKDGQRKQQQIHGCSEGAAYGRLIQHIQTIDSYAREYKK